MIFTYRSVRGMRAGRIRRGCQQIFLSSDLCSLIGPRVIRAATR